MTSEPQRYATEAAGIWGIDFPIYGDPTHKLARHLIKKEVLPDLVIADEKWIASRSTRQRIWFTNHPFMKKYTHGCAQPAIALVRSVEQKPFVSYSLSVQPTSWNGHGAADRPNIRQMWSAFKKQTVKDNPFGPATLDGSKFRKQHLIDEAYVQLVCLFVMIMVLLVGCWHHSMLTTNDAQLWGLALCGGFVSVWFELLLPAHKKKPPALAIDAPPKAKDTTEGECKT
jgi:hypothetical protein